MVDEDELTPVFLLRDAQRTREKTAQLFHECWGNARSGEYDKQKWNELQRHLELLGALPRRMA